MRLSNFNRFIGIDWSGAENPGRGLQVAQCFPGNGAPQIVLNREALNWRRREVLEWLVRLHQEGEKVLAGFDFAFAYPFCDVQAYFPGHKDSPKSVKSLWKVIDSICGGDFYGGPFYKRDNGKFSDYLLYSTYKGPKYSPRMRVADNLCAQKAGNPASVFKCVGPDSVGIGSVAGMRLLHYISSRLPEDFLIWPFQSADEGRSVIVEIFPRFFYILSGANPRQWRNRENINKALNWFNSEALPPDQALATEDQLDAIISAAALRRLANDPNIWRPAGLNGCARAYEGWIFGVE